MHLAPIFISSETDLGVKDWGGDPRETKAGDSLSTAALSLPPLCPHLRTFTAPQSEVAVVLGGPAATEGGGSAGSWRRCRAEMRVQGEVATRHHTCGVWVCVCMCSKCQLCAPVEAHGACACAHGLSLCPHQDRAAPALVQVSVCLLLHTYMCMFNVCVYSLAHAYTHVV